MFSIVFENIETPEVVISVDSPNYLNSREEQLVTKVCVRNSFGQPLNGLMKVFVSYFNFNWERIQMLQHMTFPYDLIEINVKLKNSMK